MGQKLKKCMSDLPSEPEDTNGKSNTSSHNVGKSPLRNRNAVVRGELADVPRLLSDDRCTGDKLTTDHAEEAETGLTRAEAVNAHKDERVGCKEQVKKSVDETHVDREQKNDGLGEE